jgi:hypothetical protein
VDGEDDAALHVEHAGTGHPTVGRRERPGGEGAERVHGVVVADDQHPGIAAAAPVHVRTGCAGDELRRHAEALLDQGGQRRGRGLDGRQLERRRFDLHERPQIAEQHVEVDRHGRHATRRVRATLSPMHRSHAVGSRAVAGSLSTSGSLAVAGSVATAGSLAVAGSVATAGSAAVAGSIATSGSLVVAGSIATAGSVGVVASVLNVAGIGLRRCVATLACIGCRRCVACVGCIDCVDCIGCVGCVGLRGAVGRVRARA